MLMVTPLTVGRSWQPHGLREPCSGSSPGGEVALSDPSRAAQGGLDVSALYPPHLHGLTQFSNDSRCGGRGSLGEAKNTTPRIRQLHCRGIPRIAILDLHRVVGTERCTNCQRVSLASKQRHVPYVFVRWPPLFSDPLVSICRDLSAGGFSVHVCDGSLK